VAGTLRDAPPDTLFVSGDARGEELLVGRVGLIEREGAVARGCPARRAIDDGGRGLSWRQRVAATGMARAGRRPRSESSVERDSSSITRGRSSSCDHTASKADMAAVRVLATCSVVSIFVGRPVARVRLALKEEANAVKLLT
jgi:hypothetical protein